MQDYCFSYTEKVWSCRVWSFFPFLKILKRTWLLKLFEFGSTKSKRQIKTADPDVRSEIKIFSAFLPCQKPISLFPTAHSVFLSSWLNIFFTRFFKFRGFDHNSILTSNNSEIVFLMRIFWRIKQYHQLYLIFLSFWTPPPFCCFCKCRRKHIFPWLFKQISS